MAAGSPVPIDAISPDFKAPSDWKASLRLGREFDLRLGGLDLGTGYTLTAQALFTLTSDGFLSSNPAQTHLPGALPTGIAPDGRPIYADLFARAWNGGRYTYTFAVDRTNALFGRADLVSAADAAALGVDGAPALTGDLVPQGGHSLSNPVARRDR